MTVYMGLLAWIVIVNTLCERHQVPVLNEAGEIDRYRASWGQVILTIGPVIFFIGLRSAGADTHAYISSFNSMPSGWQALFSPSTYADTTEYLFEALGILCKTIVPNYHFYLLVIALLTGIFLALGFNRESFMYPDAVALLILTGTYGWMINGIRQFLAVSIVFYASRYIVERKLIWYLVFCFIAAEIHNSAVLMIPIYFVVQGEAWNKRTLLTILGGVLAVVFVGTFMEFLGWLTDGTAYEGYTENFEEYGGGSNVLRTIIYSVPPVLAFLKREEIKEKASPFLNVAINMSIVCAVISLIANFTSGILMGRLPIYFFVYDLVLLPWLLYCTDYNRKGILPLAMYVCYFIYLMHEGNGYYYSDLFFGGRVIPAW